MSGEYTIYAVACLMLIIQFGLMAGDLLEGPEFYNVTGLFKVNCVKSITLLYLLTQNTLPLSRLGGHLLA